MNAGGDAADALQASEFGNERRFVLRAPSEGRRFVFPPDFPAEVDAPDVFLHTGKPDLVEGDPYLHVPAVAVDRGFGFPDAVPRAVVGDVVIKGEVHDRAGRVHAEHVSRPAVVIGIDGEVKPIRFHHRIPAAEEARDFIRFRIPALGGHVQGLIVVGDPDFGRLRRRLSVLRIVLGEAVRSLALPGAIVEAAVDLDRFLQPEGLDDLLARLRSGNRPLFRRGENDRPKGGQHENPFEVFIHHLRSP